jgi:transcriptional regulator with XRE-family HTH domain
LHWCTAQNETHSEGAVSMANREGIGTRVKRYREERGMSASELAAAPEISKSYLSEIENPKTGPSNLRPTRVGKVERVGKVLKAELAGSAERWLGSDAE